MVIALDVDPNKLIKTTAEKLKSMKLEKPAFVGLVKSGAHRERPPADDDFWYVRCASILRQTYVNNVVGTRKLAKHYGGRKSRGLKPEKHVHAGRSMIRKALQNLEKAGLLMKAKNKVGRTLTPQGRKLLDNTAKEVSG